MFENIVSNKYFIIALIIALAVLLYLYSQKKSCSVEGMQNIDFVEVDTEIEEKPWADDNNDGKYKNINRQTNTSFNKKTDKNNMLKRKDQLYKQYMEYKESSDPNERRAAKFLDDKIMPENNRFKKRYIKNNIPEPINDRPDLSQCQPCICPQDRLLAIDDDSESDDDIYIPSKKNKYRTPRKKLN